jgi:hypothetical protein
MNQINYSKLKKHSYLSKKRSTILNDKLTDEISLTKNIELMADEITITGLKKEDVDLILEKKEINLEELINLRLNANNTRKYDYKKDLVNKTINAIKQEKRIYDNNNQIENLIDSNYYMSFLDNSVVNPYIISSEMVTISKQLTKNKKSNYEKSKVIFDWMMNNISYGFDYRKKRRVGYKNSFEVFLDKEGICGEMTYTFIGMGRCVGLKTNYVSVKRDCNNKKVYHACACVFLDNACSEFLLVDPAYKTFDINHKDFKILEDSKVIEDYLCWRNN